MKEIEGNKNKIFGFLVMYFNEDFNDSVRKIEYMDIILVMFEIEN